MKKSVLSLFAMAMPLLLWAQGWPDNYGGVMLQSFSWNNYIDTRWEALENQADELSQYFDLIWLPQSGYCGGTSMGYDPLYFFDQRCSFGTEAQLRSLISTLKAKGTGCIADVVINHHKSISGWVTFPKETYNGVDYQLLSTDVCKNDDGGETLTWANANGFSLSSRNDTGEDWSGMRDLDHNSNNVQTIVKAYLNFLLNDIGYAGFRYDMVRGFYASFIGKYNTAANPTFSVGENWTNSSTIATWINNTKVNGVIQSGAFDFDFRYVVRSACNSGTWSRLNNSNNGSNNWPLVSNASQSYLENGALRRYAVTFVENHDMQDRGNVENYTADPLKKDTLAANAYMMALPGTPCVFMPHWKDCKQDIKSMIDVRKSTGITNTSSYSTTSYSNDYYAVTTTGNNGQLLTVVGKTSSYVPSASQWRAVADGYHYKFYMNRGREIAWISKASGYYAKAQNVMLTAVSNTGSAQIVYTTDGSEPTATNGTKVATGTVLRLKESVTLKAGLLVNGVIKNVQTRVYEFPEGLVDFSPHTATVYIMQPTVAAWKDKPLYYWAWDGVVGSLNTTKTWPGDPITDNSVEIKGKTFYYHTFNIDVEDYTFNILFNAKGSPQTVDVTGIDNDIYLMISSTTNSDGKYSLSNVTKLYASSNPLNQIEGDVNGDKIVDVADLNIVINVAMGVATNSKADINGDGEVDVSDINIVINKMLAS